VIRRRYHYRRIYERAQINISVNTKSLEDKLYILQSKYQSILSLEFSYLRLSLCLIILIRKDDKIIKIH